MKNENVVIYKKTCNANRIQIQTFKNTNLNKPVN